ncbi:hypothetical protein Tco_0079653 [Tanacetum coccineum]
MSTKVSTATETATTSNELDLLFGPLFDEYFNGENQVVSKSSAVTTADSSNKSQQQPDSTSSTSPLATTVTKTGSIHNLSVFTKMNSDTEDDIMDPVMQCTTLPSHSGFSQKKLVSFVTEIHTLSIDISLRDC